MKRTEEPTWQPLSRLPLIASLVDSGAEDAANQHDLLLKARHRPYVLDDHTVGRVISVYTEALEGVAVYEEQLNRWRRQHPSPSQTREIDRLTEVVRRLRHEVSAILTLADDLSRGTIERTMEKSDIELGLEWLLGAPLSDFEPKVGPDLDQDLEDIDPATVSEWARERARTERVDLPDGVSLARLPGPASQRWYGITHSVLGPVGRIFVRAEDEEHARLEADVVGAPTDPAFDQRRGLVGSVLRELERVLRRP